MCDACYFCFCLCVMLVITVLSLASHEVCGVGRDLGVESRGACPVSWWSQETDPCGAFVVPAVP